MNARLSILLLASMLWISTAMAQITETKFVADGGILFGQSVSLAGDQAVVGVSLTNTNAAYSFRRVGDDWIEQGMLIPADGADAEGFGNSVAITDTYAIVGAPLFDHPTATNGGASYLFEREGDSWTEQIRVAPSDVDGQDDSGISVAISGDYAIVGAHKHDGAGFDSGAAYIFKRNGNNWIEQAKLVASDEAAEDEFGIAVSISGDYALVGSWRDDDNGSGSGAAYVFQRVDDIWTEQAKLTVGDGTAGASFGISVALSGEYAIIGAPLADGGVAISGAAYVFKRNGGDWVQQDKLAAVDGVSSDFFGGSVAIEDDFAVIGAFNADGLIPGAGAAYVFNRQGSTWAQIAKLTASDGAATDLFGTVVAISEDCALVGAEGSNSVSGAAYAYCGFATLVSTQEGVPDRANLSLGQSYPNPFDQEAVIQYRLTEDVGSVLLKIYDTLGREVRVLVNEIQPSGMHSVVWDGRDARGGLAPSGIYVYQLATGTSTISRKMILLR